VRAGLELVEAVAALDTPADAPVQVRVGIATGLDISRPPSIDISPKPTITPSLHLDR
jgi:hypothetical protein